MRVNKLTNELTERDKEVLDLVVQGFSNTVIGKKLHIAEATVKAHIVRISNKFGIRENQKNNNIRNTRLLIAVEYVKYIYNNNIQD